MVIVYYVAYKLFLVMQTKRIHILILHGLFGISVAFLISVLIEKFVSTASCEGTHVRSYRVTELWYLVVSGFSIVLSIALTVIGGTYTKKQIEKLEGI